MFFNGFTWSVAKNILELGLPINAETPCTDKGIFIKGDYLDQGLKHAIDSGGINEFFRQRDETQYVIDDCNIIIIGRDDSGKEQLVEALINMSKKRNQASSDYIDLVEYEAILENSSTNLLP